MSNITKYEDIYKKLRDIFSVRYEIDLETIGRENFDAHLLGSQFKFAPRDLVYLYLDIEREFDISIPDEDVAKGALSSINKVMEMVYCQIQKKQLQAI